MPLTITDCVGFYIRYKPTMPFSERLNTFISERVFDIKKEIVNPDVASDFESNLKYFKDTGIIRVTEENSDNTIFGNKEVNIDFRVWHDYLHYKNSLDFTYEGEYLTFREHIKELPKEWILENVLLYIEIVEQTKCKLDTGKFPENQRNFTIEKLKIIRDYLYIVL